MALKDRNIHSRAGIQGKKLFLGLVAHLGAPIVATTNRIVAAVDYANATHTIAAQPDTPRNLTGTLTDANNSVTAGVTTITGKDPEGNTIVEAPTFAQLRAGWTGTKVFAQVTSVVTTGAVGGAPGVDTFVIGVGNVIGLPSSIEAAAQVRHVFLAGTRVAAPVIAVGKNKSGVDVSASTYDGAKALRVYYTPGQAAANK